MKRIKVVYTMILVVCAVIFIALIGGISIASTVNIVEDKAMEKLKLTALNASLEVDASINSVMQCVDTLSSAASYHVNDFEAFKNDDTYVDAYVEELRKLILYSAEHTQGAKSVFMRFNPEFTEPTSGLFLVYDEEEEQFIERPTTDLSKISEGEADWFELPVRNGKPTWIAPYKDERHGYSMISYAVPYYADGEVVGVIGMDINYEYINELILGIEIYEEGYAFLLDKDGNVIVHQDYSLEDVLNKKRPMKDISALFAEDYEQHAYDDGQNTIVYSKTENDLYLCVLASNKEIYNDSFTLMNKIIAVIVISLISMSVVSMIIIKKLFFMSETDELTGIYNRKYFIHMYHDMKAEDLKNYSFFIFDIDCFKGINDTYGHHVGDIAIKDVANIAKEILGKESILARWGGDEFIGIIQSNVAEKRLQQLRQTIEKRENEQYGKFTISIGLVKISGSCHFTEFYERADMLLYSSKMNGRNQLIKRD